jgi:putative Holliday junction resolvase
VVGLPIELSGKEGRSARLARQVGDMLAEKTGLPLVYHDESFSTVEAETRLQTLGKNEQQRKEMIDQIAAVVILEDWWFEL